MTKIQVVVNLRVTLNQRVLKTMKRLIHLSEKTIPVMSLNWPIHSSKGLKALETDRLFKKNNSQGEKMNAILSREE